LISHSNELFDLFALNAGTATFFQRNFDVDATSLLADVEQQNATYNVRANPLTYPGFLLDHGFREIDRAFFNYHPAPPSLLGDGDNGRIVTRTRSRSSPSGGRCFSAPPISRSRAGSERENAPGRIRTCDLSLRRRALYPLSYGRWADAS
jgi:hypothetical protein